eukprot:gnl/Trimastix_PCT/2826.p1 GENE.gnl/Trimastix_PCT/2826~~gnl/Trimastix_PCT/2826.p1  ORF type:complete len:600 (+),score=244.69 gnl/Trimastix_PCT/2826:191-1801(+)
MWDQAMRSIVNDERYRALRTLGEKKQAFQEYCAQKKKRDKEEKRRRDRQAREEFFQMLADFEEIKSTTRYHKVQQMLEEDSRFHAVEDDAQREELFEEYLVDLKKKEKENARQRRKENMAKFRELLEETDIDLRSQWKRIQPLIEDDPRYTALEKIDRLQVWEDYMRDLERQEAEKREKQREAQRRAQKKKRDAFTAFLRDMYEAGDLTAKTRWRDFHPAIKEEPAYMDLSDQGERVPQELFDSFVEDLEGKLGRDRKRIANQMKALKLEVTTKTAMQEWREALDTEEFHETMERIPQQNLDIVFLELSGKALAKEKAAIKRNERLVERFREQLRTASGITPETAWEDVRSRLNTTSHYNMLGEDEARKVFDAYVAGLAEGDRKHPRDTPLENAEEPAEEKKHRHKKHRHRHHHHSKHRSDRDKEGKESKDKDASKDASRDKDKDKDKEDRRGREEETKRERSGRDRDRDHDRGDRGDRGDREREQRSGRDHERGDRKGEGAESARHRSSHHSRDRSRDRDRERDRDSHKRHRSED